MASLVSSSWHMPLLSFSSLYALYVQFSLQGWRLAFLLLCCAYQALVAVLMLLAAAFLIVFAAREVASIGQTLLRHCFGVGDTLLGIANHSHVGTTVYALAKVISSSELSSMQ